MSFTRAVTCALIVPISVFGCGSDRGGGSASGESGLTSFTSTAAETTSADTNDTEDKFDVGVNETEGNPGDCPSGTTGGMGGEVEFSFIWIANSPEGTVSKIDTETAVEVGRYYTGPGQGTDDPSRTSVNLSGDVAVTNRGGGVTKIGATDDHCVDANNNGTIETSMGPGNIMAWGTDECVLWNQPLPGGGGLQNEEGPRPTAWDAGVGGNPCMTGDDRLWVGWYDRAGNIGNFRRLASGDGSTLDDVSVPGWGGNNWGPYGGAVDQDNNFWITGWGGPLVRINGQTLEVSRWDVPAGTHPYGIALDAEGHPWTAGLQGDLLHFDPGTQQFSTIMVGGGLGGRTLRGLQVDRDGYGWVAGNAPCGLIQFDTASKTLISDQLALPGCGQPVGVSIDFQGYVWVPDQTANMAFKVDPMTFQAQTVGGLVGPYTYSDMTGAGLDLAFNPPQG